MKKIKYITSLTIGFVALGVPMVAQAATPTAEMKKVLDAFSSMSKKTLDQSTPAEARKAPSMADAAKSVMKSEGKKAPEFTGTTDNISIPTKDGKIAARVYVPADDGPFPVIVYIHGGGWVIADLDTYDASARGLCEMAKAVVVSTDYRKARENKFPSSHDDTWAAYQWTLQNAGKYKGDAKKVAVAGESAGGNMAASIGFMAKEQNVQMPVHQLLVYPVTDHDMQTPSYRENENTAPLSAKGMKWFAEKEFASQADADNPRFAVLRSSDFKGLPPATIIAAEIDPLLSEGKAYADKLQAAGVPVTYKMYPGVTHEFFGMGAILDEAKDAENVAATELGKAFTGSAAK